MEQLPSDRGCIHYLKNSIGSDFKTRNIKLMLINPNPNPS